MKYLFSYISFQGNEFIPIVCKFHAPKYPISNSVKITMGGIFYEIKIQNVILFS